MPVSKSKPRKNSQGKQIHFSIGKVAKILKVSTSMLRKWERLGITFPERSASGYRKFTHVEVERLKEVQKLKTEKNVSSAAMVHLLKYEGRLEQRSKQQHRKLQHLAPPEKAERASGLDTFGGSRTSGYFRQLFKQY